MVSILHAFILLGLFHMNRIDDMYHLRYHILEVGTKLLYVAY